MENTTPKYSDMQVKTPVVSGGNIVRHTEEAMQEKRLTITALIAKMNAGAVVGDIVDEHEENCQKTIAEQRDLIRREQAEEEAKHRQESEDKNDGNGLPPEMTESSCKNRTKFLKSGFIKKLFGTVIRHGQENGYEEADGITVEDIPKKSGKHSSKKKTASDEQKSVKILPSQDEETIEEVSEEHAPETRRKKDSRHKPQSRKKICLKQEKAGNKVHKDITVTYAEEEIVDEYEEAAPVPEIPEPEPAMPETPERENSRRTALQEEVSHFHEPVNEDEVYRFRSALERLSADSYCSVSVYAVCIIDREFKSLSIIKNVSLLAELIEESGDNLDFYFAYIITNKGVQHYGSDEAISDVSLAMEAIRTLFIQKKGRVSVEQIQRIPSLQIFQSIYYEDSSRALRR